MSPASTPVSKRQRIAVPPDLAGQSAEGLMGILAEMLPVDFTCAAEAASPCVAEIIARGAAATPAPGANSALTSLSVPGEVASEAGKGATILKVQFANDPEVPFPYRGRSLVTKDPGSVSALRPGPDERVLAETAAGPIWVVSVGRGLKQYRSAFALPTVSTTESLRDVLCGERFMEMLPLLHFLREVCGDNRFDAPPLRACFIFDDPNLHWLRYGFVDFREIAARAVRESYHVSFATIPLDAWFTHAATAEVFRRNADRLSLTVHGNDHTRHELAQHYPPGGRTALLRQAVERIERIERATRLKVCRVMVPPHGACSEAMLTEIPRCGFEAACISHGSLRAHNEASPWTRKLGYYPSELVRGCSVMPRWGFSGDTSNTILLAAYLNQPMILRGHHQDLRGGIELLDSNARLINSLGPVTWTNLTGLSRMNCQLRLDGGTCRVRPWGPKAVVRLPRGARQMVVQPPPDSGWADWQIAGVNGAAVTIRSEDRIPLPEPLPTQISIEAVLASGAPTPPVSNRMPIPAFVRRLLTEGRDRLQPLR